MCREGGGACLCGSGTSLRMHACMHARTHACTCVDGWTSAEGGSGRNASDAAAALGGSRHVAAVAFAVGRATAMVSERTDEQVMV